MRPLRWLLGLAATALGCGAISSAFEPVPTARPFRCPPTAPTFRHVPSGEAIFVERLSEFEVVDGGIPTDGGWLLPPSDGGVVVVPVVSALCTSRQVVVEVFGQPLEVQPSQVDFGRVSIGERRALPVRVRNLLDSPMDVSVHCTTPFSVGQPGLQLSSRAEAMLDLSFQPPDAGLVLGKCTFSHAYGTVPLPLSGQGGRGRVSFEPAVVDFGPVALFVGREQTVRREVTARNVGEAPLEGRWAPPPEYAFEPLPSLDAGEARRLSLTFRPTGDIGLRDHVVRSTRSDDTVEGQLRVQADVRVMPPCVRFFAGARVSPTDGGFEGSTQFVNDGVQATQQCLVYSVRGVGIFVHGWDGGTVLLQPGEALPLHLLAVPEFDPADASVTFEISDPNGPFTYPVFVVP
ncbi:MAG: hypothetical protein AB1938_00955 [Myxococcota bacterium]